MKTNEQKKKDKVDALIACQRCRYAEKDREFLMGLNEDQLDLITPPDSVVMLVNHDMLEESILIRDGNVVVNAPKPKKGEAQGDYMIRCKGMTGMDDGKCKMAWKAAQAPVASEKEEKLETNEKPQTAEAWLNSQAEMPAEVRESIQESLSTNKAVKGQLVSNIMADSRNTFTKEQLDSKPVSELKALAAFTVQAEKQDEQKPFFGLQASLFTQAKKGEEDKGPEPLKVYSLEEAIKEDRQKK